MNRTESRLNLVTSEELCDLGQDNYDDSSSGYDSTDMSDVGSLTSYDSREHLVQADQRPEPVTRFRSTNALCDNLKMILSMPELCDVTFLVGANEIPVHGVRAILGTRSRMFYQLILKHMRSDEQTKANSSKKSSKKSSGIAPSLSMRITIPVRKYVPEVFRMLIQFVHCGAATITPDNVTGLLCGAVQFELDDLADACREFVHGYLVSGLGETLLYGARSYSHHRTGRDVLDMVRHSVHSNIEQIYEALDSEFRRKERLAVDL